MGIMNRQRVVVVVGHSYARLLQDYCEGSDAVCNSPVTHSKLLAGVALVPGGATVWRRGCRDVQCLNGIWDVESRRHFPSSW